MESQTFLNQAEEEEDEVFEIPKQTAYFFLCIVLAAAFCKSSLKEFHSTGQALGENKIRTSHIQTRMRKNAVSGETNLNKN